MCNPLYGTNLTLMTIGLLIGLGRHAWKSITKSVTTNEQRSANPLTLALWTSVVGLFLGLLLILLLRGYGEREHKKKSTTFSSSSALRDSPAYLSSALRISAARLSSVLRVSAVRIGLELVIRLVDVSRLLVLRFLVRHLRFPLVRGHVQ
jgi:hypothetical protein